MQPAFPAAASVDALDVDLGFVRFWSTSPGAILPVSLDLQHAFAPATLIVREWTDCWFQHPGADQLRLGDDWLSPITDGLFRVRFENRLGLATLQPYGAGRRLGPPLHLEVVSAKFPTPHAHLAFFQALLDDLFARATRLPFAVGGTTSRGVVEALQPPTPLFALHFFCQHADAIRRAIATVLAATHHRLRDLAHVVPLADVADVDADVLLDIVRAPDRWAPARALPFARRLGGFAPAEVWQRLPEEAHDTPENRFVLACMGAFCTAAESLPAQPWWGGVSPERRRLVADLAAHLRQAVADRRLAGVGPMRTFPAGSRVLTRRDGYRDLLVLWHVFQHARRPLFAPLSQAIDLRDAALLYEVWAYLALVEEIGVFTGEDPVVDLRLTDQSGVGWLAEARFSHGVLVYNRTRRSYSRLSMRPDFTWVPASGPDVALDAKFRLERAALEPDATEPAVARAKHDDLYRMHTYRDGLGVRAAVCVYPGDVSVFFDRGGGRRALGLEDLLFGDVSGVGALALRPDVTKGG